MPARNTAHLLEKTYDDIPKDFADEIILVDNASSDNTVEVAHSLGMKIIIHVVFVAIEYENKAYLSYE